MPREYILDLIKARVAPVDRPWEEGIVVQDGSTQPFLVERSWSGPSGHYAEQWSIRKGGSNILFEMDAELRFVRGLQSVTTITDQVDQPIALEPGSYQIVFVVEGRYMGSFAFDVGATKTAAV